MLHLPLPSFGWEDDLSDFLAMPGYSSCRGSACAAPRLYRPAAAAPAPAFRVLRAQPAFPEPEEPAVHLRRTAEGVLAACPLGCAFSREDISLELDGADLTITAWFPQTRHWRAYGRERPAAYRRTLELAPHIDSQRMRARLDTASGTLELFFPYRLAPAPQPRPRVVVVQQRAVAAPVPPAAAPRMLAARVPMPAPRAAPAPAPVVQAAPAPAPAVPAALQSVRPAPVAAPAVAAAEAAEAPAMAQRTHRRRQRTSRHVQQRQRSRSPEQAEPTCACCCQAPATTAPAPARHQQQQQQPKARPQPRTVPIESGETLAAAAAASRQPSRPSSPAVIPVESPRSAATSPAASPAASPSAAAKGKGPASPEQVAQWQRQERAAAAQRRIAAGIASDSDWEDADGSVSECGLDE